MDPRSERGPCRGPQNWTVLHALETITAPSPSTTSSLGAITALASLGDIPIILHTTRDRESIVSEIPKAPSSACFLKPSASTTTFRSTNTFGVSDDSGLPLNDLNVPSPDKASDRTAHPSSLRAPSPDPSHLWDRRRRSGGYWGNRFSAISDYSPFTVSSYLDTCIISSDSPASDSGIPRASPSVPFSVCSSDSMVLSPSESIVISPAEDEPHSPYPPQMVFDAFQFPQPHPASPDTSCKLVDVPSNSWSTMSSALFAWRGLSPSSSTGIVTSENFAISPAIRFRSPLLRSTSTYRHNTVSEDSDWDASQSLRSPSLQRRSLQPLARPLRDSFPVSPVSPRFDTLLTPPPAYTQPDDTRLSTLQASSSRQRRLKRSAHGIADFPGVLSWLHNISIEIWIDQEGFRAIRPKFRLVNYMPSLPAPSPSSIAGSIDTLTQGTALFRPVRRETSTYHHSAFDTPPVLRRLTLAGNEDKDYISRQASLTIKANGVYAVTGTEVFDEHPLAHVAALNLLHLRSDSVRDHVHTSQRQPQLHWRFEYLVEDRKTDAGRLLPGEKTLTPLSFSCSPGLLHPSHGKRIKLMHVLIKNIAPKLSAAKLATTLPSPDGIVGAGVGEQKDAISWPLTNTEQHQTHPFHRRTRSSEPATPPRASDGVPDNVTRARPASAAATAQRAESCQPNSDSRRQRTQGETATAPSRLSRQILSREELAAILASFPCPGETTSVTSPAVGLSPPSYYRHRRAQSDRQQVNELGMF